MTRFFRQLWQGLLLSVGCGSSNAMQSLGALCALSRPPTREAAPGAPHLRCAYTAPVRTWPLMCLLVFAAPSCTCSDVATVTNHEADGGRDGGTDSGVARDGGSDGGSLLKCIDGKACGDGGVCAGGTCCASDSACAGQCCGGGTLCSFATCVAPGAVCREVGDCAATEFCDFARVFGDAGVPATPDAGLCIGPTAPTGRCLPRPLVCAATDAGTPAGAGVSCVEACQFLPSGGAFAPVVKYSWGNVITAPYSSDVMMAPIVTQLDDDNCDGVVGATDQPDIVFTTFADGAYNSPGVVHAISVKGGQLVQTWERDGLFYASGQLASGNIDGVPGNEVVGCGTAGAIALRGDGTTLWSSTTACSLPAIADVDGDGEVEIITENAQLNGATGKQKVPNARTLANPVVADINRDGKPDLVSGTVALWADGSVLADAQLSSSFTAVADLDLDGLPEVIGINSGTHQLHIWHYDAAAPNHAKIIRSGLDINGTIDPARCPVGSAGQVGGGGPPTAGDFNHDGYPDIALAGGVGYAVFDGKKLMNPAVANPDVFLWTRETQDCSSAATGSSLFDFDGDGRTEAVYADELQLHIYDSATGVDRFTTCNTSGTLIEYPLVADVDNDGQADLVVASNAYAFKCTGLGTGVSGIRVFSSATNDWVVTRRIWNQHAYSVTNIEEDGTVPRVAAANWAQAGLNNFRQQKQPGFEFAAPDAVVSLEPNCAAAGTVRVVFRNLGEAPLGRGVTAELVTSTGTVLGTVSSTRVLGPAQSEAVAFTVSDPAVHAGTATVSARISGGVLRECRAGNNQSAQISLNCIN